ncbi:calcium-binding protein [Sinorhizobium numidicum]|uniref:Calcium-binding protein n=1 Tax=Sinorhizobium numidicum TaxID=680248 RepID=A0ABY8D2V9_9HYPH|nr:calcium-binding protein [Sinorhizobium numidicum]WEX79194.1 calcium-binding protein [Sinorhizobium numidicum]WEX85216.1 calcium-binding protein [Sinorhizobium numidicum]
MLDAGAGDDLLTSASGYDRLDGGEGDDRIVLLGVGGAVTGGAGFDRFTVDLSTTSETVRFNGVAGHAMIGRGQELTDHIFFSNIERLELTTGSGDDRILGTVGNDLISTRGGNDVIGTAWALDVGPIAFGDDVIDAGDGDDMISDGVGANRLSGGAGNDVVITTFSTAEADGGTGNDVLYLQHHGEPQDITVDLERGTASTGLVFRGFEKIDITLGSGDDVVFGSSNMMGSVFAGEGDNVLIGGSSRDHFDAGSGDDVMLGNGGDDTLIGRGGVDFIDGGDGNDLIRLFRPEGIIEGGAGDDTLHIAADHVMGAIDFDALAGMMGPSLVFRGIESFRVVTNLYDQNDDTLRGGGGNDVLASNNGDDLIDGRAGDDEISGGGGADRLIGGAGDDQIWGGGGADQLIGGAGADTFIWSRGALTGNGIDRVVDFDPASGDVLRFDRSALRAMGIRDFDGFLSLASDTEDGVFVSYGFGSRDGILLEGVALSSLRSDDVLFF